MGNIGEQIVAIATAIVGLAIIAVLVSNRAQTAQVINAAGDAFAGSIATAVSPVTGFTGGANTAIYGQNGSFYSGGGFPNYMH